MLMVVKMGKLMAEAEVQLILPLEPIIWHSDDAETKASRLIRRNYIQARGPGRAMILRFYVPRWTSWTMRRAERQLRASICYLCFTLK